MEIAVAIPTYNRPDDLRRCIRSIAGQSLAPSRVLVIDDGELAPESIADMRQTLEAAGSKLVYHRKDHGRIGRGLSESRNLAVHAIDEPVLLIDDDIVLDRECLLNLAKAWTDWDDGKLIGVGGVIRNDRRVGAVEKFYNRIFFLDSKSPWDINDIGYQVWDNSLMRREAGHYAHGGFCLYRPELARKVLFPAFQGGRPGLEDVHFALTAKILGYRFVIEPKATCRHLHSPSARDSQYSTGFRESVNRKIIFGDLCDNRRGNRLRFAWASVGWILRQFLVGHFAKGAGMTVGMFASPRSPEGV